MTESGGLRPARRAAPAMQASRGPRSPAMGVLLSIGAAVLTAMGWSVLRGILDLSVGLLVVAGVGGWAIGAALRGSRRGTLLAGSLGLGAWLASLVLTWLVTRLVLPGSSLDFLERLAQTSFLDYTAQQAGALEVASLVLVVGAALVSVGRPPAATGGRSRGVG